MIHPHQLWGLSQPTQSANAPDLTRTHICTSLSLSVYLSLSLSRHPRGTLLCGPASVSITFSIHFPSLCLSLSPLSCFSTNTNVIISVPSLHLLLYNPPLSSCRSFVNELLYGFKATAFNTFSRSHWGTILLFVCTCVLFQWLCECLCMPEIIIRAGAHMRCCHHSAHSCRTQCLCKMNMTFWGEATPSHADLHLSFPASILFFPLSPPSLPFSLSPALLLTPYHVPSWKSDDLGDAGISTCRIIQHYIVNPPVLVLKKRQREKDGNI